ncbi:hypothetical protein FHL15_007683 [Xylaria flabelliformis]|uniref:Uncharacterized protein n=1 Tax=Xylaria flabelliformis TaxID=2512241 RepID=A0A553HU18_9PEZI|nr:hypothetical protein FHL15_007683 [Xylaria flabelliformis]
MNSAWRLVSAAFQRYRDTAKSANREHPACNAMGFLDTHEAFVGVDFWEYPSELLTKPPNDLDDGQIGLLNYGFNVPSAQYLVFVIRIETREIPESRDGPLNSRPRELVPFATCPRITEVRVTVGDPGGPIININIGQVTDLEDLIYAVSTRLAGEFAELSYENSEPGLPDILYYQACPLPPDPDNRDNSPCTRNRSADRSIGKRRRYMQNDMSNSDTRHETSIGSLWGHQETPENEHDTKALSERRQHDADDLTSRHEGNCETGGREGEGEETECGVA